MNLAEARAWGIQELAVSSDTAGLDAELLLAEALQVSRAYLIAHAEQSLTLSQQSRYQQILARRKQGEPLAYILGHKEFWSLNLRVTPATLIPRPETELLVELLLQLFPAGASKRRVADLGTGSGALALALAKERPVWEIYATDQSSEALRVASHNAMALQIKTIQFRQGSWCAALPPLLFDAIVSNPPYLSESEWREGPPGLSFEPRPALVSGEGGLEAIATIIREAKTYLRPEAFLLLEHGSQQAAAVRKLLEKEGYIDLASYHDLAGIERVTGGRWPT